MTVALSSVSRRTAVRLGAGSLAAGLASRGLSPVAAQGNPATFVLVPGQWTGAFVWHTVAPILRDAGHNVYPVTCSGLGDRVHRASPDIDLDTHITDVVNAIEYEDLHDVVLVGHSYAGMIITGVAERIPERLSQVVYLDAFVPEDGQNVYDADWIDEAVKNEMIVTDITGGMEAGTPGYRPVFPEIEEWLRGSIKDPAEADWFMAKLVPHPLLSNLQPVKIGNPEAAALPHAFILCTADKDMEADPQMDPFARAAERLRAEANWTIIEMDDTHMVNLNDPQGTAEALMSLL